MSPGEVDVGQPLRTDSSLTPPPVSHALKHLPILKMNLPFPNQLKNEPPFSDPFPNQLKNEPPLFRTQFSEPSENEPSWLVLKR